MKNLINKHSVGECLTLKNTDDLIKTKIISARFSNDPVGYAKDVMTLKDGVAYVITDFCPTCRQVYIKVNDSTVMVHYKYVKEVLDK